MPTFNLSQLSLASVGTRFSYQRTIARSDDRRNHHTRTMPLACHAFKQHVQNHPGDPHYDRSRLLSPPPLPLSPIKLIVARKRASLQTSAGVTSTVYIEPCNPPIWKPGVDHLVFIEESCDNVGLIAVKIHCRNHRE